MATAVKKTISLPPDLATEAETLAKEEGKTLSAVIQDALRLARQERMKNEFREMQGYKGERQGDTDHISHTPAKYRLHELGRLFICINPIVDPIQQFQNYSLVVRDCNDISGFLDQSAMETNSNQKKLSD